jgi:dihydrofolate synthase / folylpolyglutamate synthase
VKPRLTWEDFYSLQRFGMTPDLSNIMKFCERLHHPESTFPSVHIAGTNGKGSTTAILESILRTSGYKVGMYTSPHIMRFEERIRINGKLITEPEVLCFLEEHWTFIRENKCTFFEVATAMAMDYFRRGSVDVAVVEVGLGGTYDATRVVKSVLSVITHIDIDHKDRLGDTLELIARQKAGIFRSGQPAVTYRQHSGVLTVLKERAGETGTDLHLAEDLVSLFSLTVSSRHISGRATLRALGDGIHLPRWKCPLTGAHQISNIKLALAASSLLINQFPGIQPETIVQGVNSVNWPGRLQVLGRNPHLIVDVGHNPNAIRTTLSSIHKIWKDRTVHVIFSALRDKDVSAMIASLKEEHGAAFIVPLPPPRGFTLEELHTLAEASHWSATPCTDVNEALNLALSQAGLRDIILVIGSHYLAQEVLKTQNIS